MPTLNTPIVIPAVEQKTADKIWISRLVIDAPSLNSPVSIRAQISPYSSSSGEIFNEKSQLLVIDDLYTLAAQDQQIGTAVGYFIDAINKICQDRNMFWPAPEPTPTPDPAP